LAASLALETGLVITFFVTFFTTFLRREAASASRKKVTSEWLYKALAVQVEQIGPWMASLTASAFFTPLAISKILRASKIVATPMVTER